MDKFNSRSEELILVDPNEDNLIELTELKLALKMEVEKKSYFENKVQKSVSLNLKIATRLFFHKFASSCRKKNNIRGLKNKDGAWVLKEKGMVEVVVDYFKELFMASSVIDCEHVPSGITLSISGSMNDELSDVFT